MQETRKIVSATLLGIAILFGLTLGLYALYNAIFDKPVVNYCAEKPTLGVYMPINAELPLDVVYDQNTRVMYAVSYKEELGDDICIMLHNSDGSPMIYEDDQRYPILKEK